MPLPGRRVHLMDVGGAIINVTETANKGISCITTHLFHPYRFGAKSARSSRDFDLGGPCDGVCVYHAVIS